ncbi:MAG TPA: hypothetical protein VMI54_01165, partial [Polyangiaceae bacterium]|nr:hypothetical protein [Polyangiaceae bacterium]
GALGAVAVTLALAASPAAAQESQDQAENIAAARSLGIAGVQLAEAGKCDQAIEKLNRAESLYHAPTILDRLGECQVKIGQIVLGTENLNKVVREQLAPNAPRAFREAQARAQKALDAALPRIGHLTVNVEPKEAKITVTVSDVAVPPALIGVERPTDPGTHEVVASAPGYLTQKTTVTLAEAGRETVTLRLTLDPNAPKEEPVVAPPVTAQPLTNEQQPPPPATANSNGAKTAGYVLIGVGAAGVVAGSITGAMALQKKSGLDCPDNHCSGSQKNDLDSAKSIALVSTVTFAVGIPAVAVGTILLLTSGSSEKKAAKQPPRHFAAQPYFGTTSAGIVGEFW